MKDFVTFEIAKRLKEKGFPQKTFGTYDMVGATYLNDGRFYKDGCIYHKEDVYTISQVLKWLREEKELHIEPCILVDADPGTDGNIVNEYIYWSFCVTSIETGDMIYFEYEHINAKRFDTYEQASIAGIEYVLDNLI